MAPTTSFPIGFNKENKYVQSMAPNSSFSIGFGKDIGDNQCMAPNTSVSTGFDTEFECVAYSQLWLLRASSGSRKTIENLRKSKNAAATSKNH